MTRDRNLFFAPYRVGEKVLWLICDNVPSNTYIFSWSLIELETRQYQPPQMPGSLHPPCNPYRSQLVLPLRAAKLSSLVKVSIFFDGAALSLIPEMLFHRTLLISFICVSPGHPLTRRERQINPLGMDIIAVWKIRIARREANKNIVMHLARILA